MKSFDSHGQALVEFVLSLALVIIALVGVVGVLRLEWQRARCAYWVFEKVHAERIGALPPRSRLFVRIESTDHGISGEGRCGSVRERIELPFLESAQW